MVISICSAGEGEETISVDNGIDLFILICVDKVLIDTNTCSVEKDVVDVDGDIVGKGFGKTVKEKFEQNEVMLSF